MAGLFGIGQVPTGDRDPFGLRRAALGVIRILVEKRVAVRLEPLVNAAFKVFSDNPAVQDRQTDLTVFITERLRGYLRDLGYSVNEVAAVVDDFPSELYLIPEQLQAIRMFAALPDAPALAAANKRIVNILRKNGQVITYGAQAVAPVDTALLEPGAEADLARTFTALAADVDARCAAGDWTGALVALASSRAVVDRFFDDVMVMADDPAVRANRLNLLANVAATMNRVANIGKLA
jgi:glycyl-tRNA synthetase beta chain